MARVGLRLTEDSVSPLVTSESFSSAILLEGAGDKRDQGRVPYQEKSQLGTARSLIRNAYTDMLYRFYTSSLNRLPASNVYIRCVHNCLKNHL